MNYAKHNLISCIFLQYLANYSEYTNVNDAQNLSANSVEKTDKKLLTKMEYGLNTHIVSVIAVSKISLKFIKQL